MIDVIGSSENFPIIEQKRKRELPSFTLSLGGKKMKEKVLNTIKKFNLIENGDKLVLGVSGGPDSICMLNILNDIKNDKILHMDFDIIVAHVNHMIREEAKDDEVFVKEYCEKINVEFYSKSIDVQKIANNDKIGTEEAGRNARYEFFDEILQKTNSNKIAIAHNKNDKVETIIMNVLRGSGISGLKGIEPIKNNKYIRPLIECERSEIEEYCKNKNIKPRIDKTNFENIYTRNKTRNVVIPYIKQEFNPNIIQTIDRLSDLVKEEDEYLEKLVEQTYKEIIIEEKPKEFVMDLKKFNKQEKVIKSRILLYTISKILGSTKGIEKIHIEDVIKMCSNNIGNKYLTPNKNIKILIKNHNIYFINQR
jgi:tRNA(Ile)-lysidine synthase